MTEAPDRSQEYALVRELREWVKRCDRPRSDKTQADYERTYARMISTGALPEHATTRQTFYKRRAALVWATLERTKEALRNRDKSIYGTPEWAAAMDDLEQAQRVLRRYPPDPDRQHQETGSAAFTWSDLPQGKQGNPHSQSKRRTLSYLSRIPNWRERLFGQVAEKHKAAAAVCALSGARPSEIARGVEVTQDGDTLLLRILGAKITHSSGQPERLLRIAIDSVEARYLLALAEAGPVTVATKAQAFCAAIERAGIQAFPRARQRISPYVYRHALASSLKAEGIEPLQIAACLGHLVTASQSAYGRAVHGGRSSAVLAVRASMPVLETHRAPPPLRQPSSAHAPRPTF